MLTPHALRPLAAAMLLFLTSMPLPSHAADTTRVVTARQFGAIPDDGRDDTKALRAAALYREDAGKALRKSHQNPEIQALYEEFLGRPNGHKAHELLHTTYMARPKYSK